MKFTKEEAFEKLKGYLTNNGKKTLRMSERSINKQLESLMPLIAGEDMELDDFIGKVKDTFSVMNSNVEKDNSDFVKEWEKNHPVENPKPSDPKPTEPKPDDATAALLKRIEELEKKETERTREAAITQKRKELLKAMKEIKIYNKSAASDTGEGATPYGSSLGGDQNKKDPFAEARKIVEQRHKDREGLLNNN